MTWEELCKKAKEMGCNLFISKSKYNDKEFDEEAFSLSSDKRTFYQDGTVHLHNIEPDKMFSIMEVLQ